jgi:hypothetical protein
MAYSKAKLKSSDDDTSCFRPFWIGKLSDKYVFTYMDFLYVLFKDILISLTSFMGTPNFMGILYNTSLLTES